MDLIAEIGKADKQLQEPVCPEARRRMGDDGPARCQLTNLKACIRDTNPPYGCDYYNDFLEEMKDEGNV